MDNPLFLTTLRPFAQSYNKMRFAISEMSTNNLKKVLWKCQKSTSDKDEYWAATQVLRQEVVNEIYRRGEK